MAGYYDLILGLIPLTLAGITGTALVGGLALTTAVQVASLAAVALVAHAMFVRAPVEDVPATASAGSNAAYGSAD
ncbi:hypothetical protein BRC83_08125 [Halobacteriales archaeon QS_1_68_17]|nr:MAG: hypothetical protein BRC83_08125 [Halobacteriales archaeon QS_1_68_17]